MGFMDLVKLRKSVRAYVPGQEIDSKTLNKILDAARFAPSAKNIQDWKFIVVRDKNLLSELVPGCKDQKFISQAAAIIVGCSDKTDYVMTCGQPAYTVNLAVALEHMALMAAELGIGSCWLGAFYEDKVKEILDIPSTVRVVNMLTLGYPVQELSRIVTTTRKDVDEMVCYNKWTF
jgi:nitroreductase